MNIIIDAVRRIDRNDIRNFVNNELYMSITTVFLLFVFFYNATISFTFAILFSCMFAYTDATPFISKRSRELILIYALGENLTQKQVSHIQEKVVEKIVEMETCKLLDSDGYMKMMMLQMKEWLRTNDFDFVIDNPQWSYIIRNDKSDAMIHMVIDGDHWDISYHNRDKDCISHFRVLYDKTILEKLKHFTSLTKK
jgi:hypothetical protein